MKKELRAKLLKIRSSLKDKEAKDQQIISRLKSLIGKDDRILIYYPLRDEVNILKLVDDEEKFYLPYCYQKGDMEIRRFSFSDLTYDEMKMKTSRLKTKAEVNVALIPAVGANISGYRLGFGGGYYDRFLKGKKILKILVVYDACLVDIPFEDAWDIRCDYIVTEKRTIEVLKNV